MANNGNLTPFTKNDDRASKAGKKGGNTPKLSFKKTLREILEKAKKKKKYSDVQIEELLHAYLKQSKKNPSFAKLILQLNNELKEIKEHTGEDGGPIEIVNLSKKQYIKIRQDMLKKDDV